MSPKQLCPIAALVLSALAPASAGTPPPVPIAVFSQDDSQFSETFTLFADNTYRQEETQKKPLYGTRFDPILMPDGPADPMALLRPKRTGTWRVLDKDGRRPILFTTFAVLPKDAVISLTNAMPFGITWERQSPSSLMERALSQPAHFRLRP